MVKHKLKQSYPNLFIVTCKDPYDLSMLFCRAQEFYESPFTCIRGKKFDIFDFQKLYSKKFGNGVFSYPLDWCGFNIPGHVLDNFSKLHASGYEQSLYDKTFSHILEEISKQKTHDGNYYLIGSVANDEQTAEHELCHAFYYLKKYYRTQVDNTIKKTLDNTLFDTVKQFLQSKGYSGNVILDEINAYFSTGYCYIVDNIKTNVKQRKVLKELSSLLEDEFYKHLL